MLYKGREFRFDRIWCRCLVEPYEQSDRSCGHLMYLFAAQIDWWGRTCALQRDPPRLGCVQRSLWSVCPSHCDVSTGYPVGAAVASSLPVAAWYLAVPSREVTPQWISMQKYIRNSTINVSWAKPLNIHSKYPSVMASSAYTLITPHPSVYPPQRLSSLCTPAHRRLRDLLFLQPRTRYLSASRDPAALISALPRV